MIKGLLEGFQQPWAFIYPSSVSSHNKHIKIFWWRHPSPSQRTLLSSRAEVCTQIAKICLAYLHCVILLHQQCVTCVICVFLINSACETTDFSHMLCLLLKKNQTFNFNLPLNWIEQCLFLRFVKTSQFLLFFPLARTLDKAKKNKKKTKTDPSHPRKGQSTLGQLLFSFAITNIV